ncbi:MAG: DUF2203 family protein [Nitrososphaerota archaeon]
MGYFSIDKAEKLIPELSRLLTEARAKLLVFEKGSIGNNGLSNDLTQIIKEIESWGVIVRDIASGIVDIPALRNGEPVYLCWRLGEKRIMYWHPLEAGLSSRRVIIRSEFLSDEEIYQKLLTDKRPYYESFENEEGIVIYVDIRGWRIDNLDVMLIGRLLQIKWESEGLIFRREITLPSENKYIVREWKLRNGQLIINLDKNLPQKKPIKPSEKVRP